MVSPPQVVSETGAVEVTMRVFPPPANGRVAYTAPPPPDHRVSFSGSGLPFASAKDAFESTRASRGVAAVDLDGTFVALLHFGMPGSYYADLGSTLVPPCVHVTYVCEGGRRVRLIATLMNDGIPHRSLNHPPSRKQDGSAFYRDEVSRNMVRAQDQILRDSAWTASAQGWHGQDADRFWTKRPRN